MQVIDIENETFTKEFAEGWNNIALAMPWKYKTLAKEGDILYGDIELNGTTYKSVGQYKGVNPLDKNSVLTTLEDHKKAFKQEYHWILTRNQEGIYKFYRSAKILKTLHRERPDKF